MLPKNGGREEAVEDGGLGDKVQTRIEKLCEMRFHLLVLQNHV